MASLTPFIVTSVVITGLALLLQAFSLRQIVYDFMNHEKLRPLVVSHLFTYAASLIICILSIDSQGGLDIYNQGAILLLGNSKSFLLLASARALAAAFVDSHKLMTSGPSASRVSTQTLVHAVSSVIGLTMFIVLAATRYTWLSVAAKAIICVYSFLVSGQVIRSAVQVRRILLEEHARSGNYADGIRKLTRLIVLVIVLVILGNMAILVGLVSDVNLAKTSLLISDSISAFSGSRILGDVSGLIAVGALQMGSWNVKKSADTTPSKKSTSPKAETRAESRRVTRTHTTTMNVEPSKGPTDTQLDPDVAQRMEREISSTLPKMENISRDASKDIDGNCMIEIGNENPDI